MAYGLNANPFLLKEAYPAIGTWLNPQSLTPAANPASSFTSNGILGYFRQGTEVVGISRQFATFISGTPGKIVRKDLVLKGFMLTFQMAQYNANLLALAQGLDVDTGAYDLAWIGSDEPTQTFNGYNVPGQLTDGTPFAIAMWYGKVTSEEVGWTYSGTEHSTYELKIEAFEHPNFTNPSNTNDQHNYGMIYFTETSGS